MDKSKFIKQAVAAIRVGDKEEARKLLSQVLKANPVHEQAWLGMSRVMETDAERIRCLEQVLVINPHNEIAVKDLMQLKKQQVQTTADPLIESVRCPHCGFENRTTARFCIKCGHKLQNESPLTGPQRLSLKPISGSVFHPEMRVSKSSQAQSARQRQSQKGVTRKESDRSKLPRWISITALILLGMMILGFIGLCVWFVITQIL